MTHVGAAAATIGSGQPLSMVSADFDQDGVQDLVVGFSTPSGGVIAWYRGNLDAFAPQSDASFQAIGRGEFPSPFLPEAQTLAVPVRPDFIAAGDFTGMGHTDLVVAARGGNAVYILAGDGKGNFTPAQTINLPGGLTALAADAFGGMHTALLLGISSGSQSFLAVYGPGQQGFAPLAAVPLNAPASNILFGDFGDPGRDAAFLSGGQVQILRSSTLKAAPVSLPVSVQAFALGSFIYDRSYGPQIALLASDGSVQIAARNEFNPQVYTVQEFAAIRQAKINRQPAPAFVPAPSFPANGWKIVESFPAVSTVAPGQQPVFFRTRVSSNGADDIMWLSSSKGQMAVISHTDQQPGAATFIPGQVSVKPYTGSPIAALPVRLNVDGRPGLIAIHQGEVTPSLSMPIPDPNFFVNTDADPTPGTPASTCNNTSFTDLSSSCSLREAVIKANGDNIMLQAGHTYSLTIGRGATQDYTGNTGALYMNHTATIVGGNQNTTVIQWGTPSTGTVDMVMAVNEDISIISNSTGSLSNLTIQGGINHGTQGNDGDGGCMEFDTGSSGTATLTLTNVTLQNCSTLQGGGGGLVIFSFVNPAGGGGATISGSIIQNNSVVASGQAGNGGGIAIAQDGHMTMTNSQVLNNSAVQNCTPSCGLGAGGGIVAFAPQNVSATTAETFIHSSTISGNKAAGFGGGINSSASFSIDTGTIISGNIAGTDGTSNTAHANQEGGGFYSNPTNPCPSSSTCTTTLSKVTITGNTATGNGGGISHGNASAGTTGSLTMNFSRLAGNSTSGGSGSNLSNNHATASVTDNWWGTNAPAGTINSISATTTFDPFIVLTHTGVNQKIQINGSSVLTGDMSKDNHGVGTALAGNLDEIVGLPITFDNAPPLGSIPQAQPETLGNPVPTATATFNAGGTAGLGTANATVDQAVVAVNSNLISSATESGSTATITTVGAHGFSPGEFVSISGVSVSGYDGNFFTILATPTATTFTYTAGSSGLGAGSGGSANAGIIILAPPSITKSFNFTTIQTTGGTGTKPKVSTITFFVDNSVNVVPINASFTDNLPTNLVVATPSFPGNGCGGTVTATAGSTSISYSNPALAAGSCAVTVNVQSAVDNTYSNSVTIDSTDAGNGNTSTANLTVISPPTSAKAFGAATIPLNGTTSMTITISSTNINLTLGGISFTDTLPAGLVVATPNGLSTTCTGTATATAGSGSVSLSGASLAPGASCTVTANVQATTAGVKNNSVEASDTVAGPGNTANASVTVVAPPTITKAFGAASIPLNGSTSLSFTINNPNASVSLSGVAFSDTLPAGLIVSTPNGLTGSCGSGTITATQGTGTISLSGGTIAAAGSCTFSVNVTGTAAGTQSNTTGAVSSTEGGTGTASNTASVTVVAPPSIAKAFNPTSIPLNGTTALTFTITNPAANTVALTGVAFTDTLPTGLTVANATATVCGGTLTTTAPTGISLTGATIAVNSQCQFSVTVTGAASGQYTNTTGAVSSTNGGTGNTASANLTVASPATVAKAFGALQIPVNGTTSLTVTITNPNTGVALSGLAFTDSLPAGLVVAATPNLNNTCGGTATAVASSGTVSLSGGTVAASASCTVSVNVQGTTAGIKNNSVTVTSTEGGASTPATASITVVSPPTISKAFGAASIPLNGSTSLSFTINNPNTTVSLSGVAFSDTLPAGLIISTPNGLTGSCGSGTITATQGTGTISLSGGTIAAAGSCNFSVNVTGTAAGTQSNTTGAVTSTEGGTGTASNTATVTVVAPPSIAKAFNPGGIQPNGVSTLTITITNPAVNTVAEAGVAFTDNLPANVVVATPNGLGNSCGGTATATAGSGSVSLTGGTVAVNSSCTVTVNVTSSFTGTYTNTTGPVSSTNGGTGGSATATLVVANPPTISKLFVPSTIPQGGTTLVSFTITNPNSNSTPPNSDVGLTGISFTDTLPAGLVVATPNNISNDCGGTVTANSGTNSITLTGGSLGPAVGLSRRNSRVRPQTGFASAGSCFVSLSVVATVTGTLNNTTGPISANESGPGATSNTAALQVIGPPTVAKAFGAASVPLNGTTSLTFTFANPTVATTFVNVSLSDTLPTGLVVASPNGAGGTCGGTITANPGTSSITVGGFNLAAGGSCTATVNVTGTTAGTKNNVSSPVTATFDDGSGNFVSITGGTASASLAVVAPPSIAKAFNLNLINPGAASTLTFTITNPGANTVAEAGVAFTDTLPANLLVATPNGLTNSCGGTATATAGSGSISLTGGTVGVGSTCAVSVSVTSSVPGTYTNTTGAVSSTNGGTGNTATAVLNVKNASLSITKTHQGQFHRGQSGAQYTITVSNGATAGSTTGTVTVVDTLPNITNPPVATAISGTGWTCTLSTLTCTRSDVLAPGASYPAITLTVDIPKNIRNNFTNQATVSGGGDPNSHTASDPVTLGPPIIITSTDTGTASVAGGNPAFFNFSVDATAVNSPIAVISFTCTGLPAGSACLFSPLAESQVQGISALTLTVTTLGHGSSLLAPPNGKTAAPLYATLLFPVVGLLGFGLRRTRAKKLGLRLGLAFGGLIVLLALAGCGGTPRGVPTVTTAGTFTITVTGTANTPAGPAQGSATVTLTVQ